MALRLDLVTSVVAFLALVVVVVVVVVLVVVTVVFQPGRPGKFGHRCPFFPAELLPPENVFDCCPNHIGIDSPHRLIGFIKILAHLLRCVLGFIELCLL